MEATKKVLLIGAIVGAAVLVLGLVGLGLWRFARPAYRHHKEVRFLAQAEEYLAKRDFRNASISARQTLQINPANVTACRIMAQLAELARSPSSLDWRRRLAEVAPTVENKLALAAVALRVQRSPYPLAAQVLQDLAAAGKQNPTYHLLAAELAVKLERPWEAAPHYQAASQLEPTNQLHQLNLAKVRLQSTNAAEVAGARALLEQLRQSTNVSAVALRWLVADSLRENQLARAGQYSRQLIADPHGTLDDRLQHLYLLQKTGQPEFKPYLASLQKGASTNAIDLHGIGSWMVNHGLAEEAVRWLTNFPAEVRNQLPVPIALADAHLVRKDWPTLTATFEDQKWGELEFLRFGYLARAAREQDQAVASQNHWRAALKEASERAGPLITLFGMAEVWGWPTEKEEALWLLVQRFPAERWALRELDRFYVARGNTRGLHRTYTAMLGNDPNDFVAKNNLATTSLLLKQNLNDAHKWAREVHAQRPEEPIVVSTYAYSLHLQGRTREGLAALEKLKSEQLQTPVVAAYYTVLLSAEGLTAQARKHLESANRAKLLPEEKALLEEAAKTL